VPDDHDPNRWRDPTRYPLEQPPGLKRYPDQQRQENLERLVPEQIPRQGDKNRRNKVSNAPLTKERASELQQRESYATAKEAATDALKKWYSRAYLAAEKQYPDQQRRENLERLKRIENWKELKDPKDAYVMVRSLLDGDFKPVILKLDDSHVRSGFLSYRKLHQQLRTYLNIDEKTSLRVCPDRGWYPYTTNVVGKYFPPEAKVLPCHNGNSKDIWGTTLVYYKYV
jgi:hypothetical protein